MGKEYDAQSGMYWSTPTRDSDSRVRKGSRIQDFFPELQLIIDASSSRQPAGPQHTATPMERAARGTAHWNMPFQYRRTFAPPCNDTLVPIAPDDGVAPEPFAQVFGGEVVFSSRSNFDSPDDILAVNITGSPAQSEYIIRTGARDRQSGVRLLQVGYRWDVYFVRDQNGGPNVSTLRRAELAPDEVVQDQPSPGGLVHDSLCVERRFSPAAAVNGVDFDDDSYRASRVVVSWMVFAWDFLDNATAKTVGCIVWAPQRLDDDLVRRNCIPEEVPS